MLRLNSKFRAYVWTGVVDMRRQFDGLAAIVREGMKRDPLRGDLFLFRNRRGDIVKLLFHDSQGGCVLSKRLDSGTFKFDITRSGEKSCVEVSSEVLGEIMFAVREARRKNP